MAALVFLRLAGVETHRESDLFAVHQILKIWDEWCDRRRYAEAVGGCQQCPSGAWKVLVGQISPRYLQAARISCLETSQTRCRDARRLAGRHQRRAIRETIPLTVLASAMPVRGGEGD